jgi:hypothetical protein
MSDERNRRTEACGCKLVRLASTPTRPSGWYYTSRCDEHKEVS